jgi:2-succinyl-5-enolpyruvyl-6-hydroxy-3-cyclohexene-1-carboxylate synthase
MHHLQHIAELGSLLEALGARQVIIAPGSRNAPLIQLFTADKQFSCHSIVDERSAAYVALGMCKELGEPVVLVTTSGTAVLNLSPALAEAFQQELPLLVLTADRPPELINQFNNQVFDQRAPFYNFTKGFYEFPAAVGEKEDLEKAIRSVTTLCMEALAYPAGPVHVNLPLMEPLYVPLPDPILSMEGVRKGLQEHASFSDPDPEPELDLRGKKVLILAGMGRGNPELMQVLEQVPAAVVAENIANMPSDACISVPELVLAGASDGERMALEPDLVITYGQQVVSKRLKIFLQSREKLEVRELRVAGPALADLFRKCTDQEGAAASYRDLWKGIEDRECKRAEDYFKQAAFGNLSALVRILKAIPSQSTVHLGNSTTIRFSQLVRARSDLRYYSNRGISGIDGSLSSAVGAAMVSDRQHLLILGDLSFVYDSNALWNKDFPENLKIVVLNDGGGGIFRLLDGPGDMKFFEEFSVTHHPVSLELLSASYGRMASRAGNMEELDQLLPALWSTGHGLAVLEVDTTGSENSRIFKDLFK